MRSLIQRTVEVLLALAFLALLALLIAPWPQRPFPAQASTPWTAATQKSEKPAASAASLPPEVILPLFIGRIMSAPASAPGATPAKPAMSVAWLQYLGFSSASDGASLWYVKDTRTGKVIKLAQGQARNGWSIVKNKDTQLILKNGDDLYSVNKR